MRTLLLALSLCFVFAGCKDGAQNKIRIGVSIPAATHGWSGGVVWCAEQTKMKLEAENKDIEVIIATSPDISSQVESIENLMIKDIDALVVMAQESEPLTTVCENAKNSGAFLVVVSNPLAKPVEDVFVNGDNSSFGAAAAEAMGALLDGKGNILVMEGIPCPINTERVQAFQKIMTEKYPEIHILDSQPANWNTEKGMSLMENYLLKHPAIDGVWAGDDDVLLGALKAYEESGRTDLKVFVGGGGSKNIVKLVKEGHPTVKATITYPPQMIETAINIAVDALKTGRNVPETEKIRIIPSKIITKDNAGDFYFPDSVY